MDIILHIVLGQITGIPIRVFATWNSPGTRFGVLRPGIRLGSQFGLLRPGIRIPGRKTKFKAAICLILASNAPPPQAFSGLLALTFSPAENAPPWIFGTCYFSNWSELIGIEKNLSAFMRICQNL